MTSLSANKECTVLVANGSDFERLRQLLEAITETTYRLIVVDESTSLAAVCQSRSISAVLLIADDAVIAHSEMLQQLASLKQAVGLPIIVVGQNDAECAVQALRAGATDYLGHDRLTATKLHQSLQRAIATSRPLPTWLDDAPTSPSDEQFRAIADQAPVVIWSTTPEGDCTFVSNGWQSLTGQSPEAALGRGWLDSVHVDDRDRVLQAFLEANTRQKSFSFDYRLQGPDGEYRWAICAGRPYQDREGNFSGFSGIDLSIQDRKDVETALQHGEEQRHLILDLLDIGWWDWNTLTNRFIWSDRLFQLLGYAPHEVAPSVETWQARIHPDDQAWTRELLEQALETGVFPEVEYRVVCPDGSLRWILVKAQGSYDAQGQPVHVVGIVLDVSDRKRADTLLQASYDTFCNLVENSPFGLFVVDAEFRMAKVSLGAQAILATVHPLLGRDFADIIHEMWPDPFASEVITRFRHTLATGEPYRAPSITERRQDTGVLESYDWEIKRLTLPDGRYGVVCHFYDLSERLRYEAALRDSEARFRSMADHAPMIVWVTDPTGYCTYLSQGWYDLTGQTEEEGLGLDWEQVIHPDDRSTTERQFQEALQQQAAVYMEYRLKTKHEDYVWVIDAANPWFSAEGELQGYVGSMLDISDRKQVEAERQHLLEREQQAREEAERANRVKDEFLAVLSHELRSPLNPILGWSQMLQTEKFDAATTQRALATIERNVKLQTQLIDDLLDIARILRGKLKIEQTPVNLVTVIESALEVVSTAAAAKSITLCSTFADTCQVYGDEGRLQQIVWNLLSNAVKFTPPDGHVEVRLETTDNQAQITVADTGKGISPEFLPHLFQSFRQEDSSTTRKYGGLGLGLSIVKYLVSAHGGTITADSLGEGSGATFTVQIPLLVRETVPPPPNAALPNPEDLSGIRVLAVDDHADSRELLKMMLPEYGAEVYISASGAEALPLLVSVRPDILICDIGMPDMDGYTLLKHVRALSADQGGDVPAIALTAFARDEDRQLALQQGFQEHIAKPLSMTALVRAISALTPLRR